MADLIPWVTMQNMAYIPCIARPTPRLFILNFCRFVTGFWCLNTYQGENLIKCLYSFCNKLWIIFNFYFCPQANEAGTSNAMELLGAKKCFERLQKENIDVSVFVSDRHTGIAKWIKDHQTSTRHFYDIWHVARSICKKIAQAAKEKGLGRLQHWIKGIRRHLYWCILSTRRGFGALIYAKWTSIMRHVADKHDGHDNPLFPKCKHQDLERRKWIKIGRYFLLFLFFRPCIHLLFDELLKIQYTLESL